MKNSVGFRMDGAPRRTIEVENAEGFARAMNNRPDVGRIEVVVQVRDRQKDPWLDLETVYTGEWDRHRKPPVPSQRDLVAVARAAGVRFARTVIRSQV